MALALTVGVLIGGGVFMMLRRGMVRLIIGFALLSHGVNLLIMSTGGIDRRGEPLGSSPDPATTADALPQAFVLTAIVISFAVTVLLLVLAVTGRSDDQVADPSEDADPHELAAADARFPRAELGAAVRHLATQPQPVLHGSHRHDDREERR